MIKTIFAIVLFSAMIMASAFAQGAQTPGGQTVQQIVPMCHNGIVNSDGTFQVVPCSKTFGSTFGTPASMQGIGRISR